MRRSRARPRSHLSERGEWNTLLGSRIPMASLIQTLAVAQYLSFRHAARALGISQSSVSARVKILEDELGVRLFERSTRGVRLTEAGQHFVEQVDGAMEMLDHAIKSAGMRASGEEGRLRIGVYALIGGGFLDQLLKRFRSKHERVRIQITEGTAKDAQLQIREGGLDVAFMACTHEIPDLHSKVVWRDRLTVALSKQHPLAKCREVEWQQLADQTFLVRQGGAGPQIHDLILMRFAGRWPDIRRFEVGRDSLLSMIAAGHGISLFVEESATASPSNIAFLPISDEPEIVAFSAVWSPSNRNPVLKSFLSLATEMQRS